jgi:hypothetical protein
MAFSERIIFQPYHRGKRGDVIAGVAVVFRTPEEARRRADIRPIQVAGSTGHLGNVG